MNLYIAKHFYESRAMLRSSVTHNIEIQRWSGKYTLAAKPRKQMAYISDDEAEVVQQEGKKGKQRKEGVGKKEWGLNI